MTTNTTENQQLSIKNHINTLVIKEAKFTTETINLVIQLKNGIDISKDTEALEICRVKLMQAHKSLENISGEIYMASLQAKGRLSYIKDDRSVK
jgi:hypothetical protein